METALEGLPKPGPFFRLRCIKVLLIGSGLPLPPPFFPSHFSLQFFPLRAVLPPEREEFTSLEPSRNSSSSSSSEFFS